MQTLEEYSTNYIFELIQEKNKHKEMFVTNHGTFYVKTSGHRLSQFKKQNFCACCGLIGNLFKLERQGNENPHLNLYNRTNSTDILFTKDHIVPKSLGGKDHMDNYQTMCVVCNNIKSSFNVSMDDLKTAKTMFDSCFSRVEIESFMVQSEQKNKKT